MHKLSLIFALCMCVCTAVYAQSQLVGGIQGEKPADDDVRKVVVEMKDDIEKMANKKYVSLEPLSVRKQTVAGLNYFIKAKGTHKDGSISHIHIRIYRPFRGPLELTAVRADVDEDKPLGYFQ